MSDLEQRIAAAAERAVIAAVEGELTGYNKPLSQLVSAVIEHRSGELRKQVDDVLITMIGGDAFRESLRVELNRKLAKVLVSRMGGALEARVNEMTSNPETRAKVITALGAALDEMSKCPS